MNRRPGEGNAAYRGAAIWVICGIVAVAGVVLAYHWVEPAPPQRVRIAAGAIDGAYRRTAEAYSRTFDENGVELDIVATAGSVENYARLLAGEVDLALIQGGTLPEDVDQRARAEQDLQTIASVYLEPLFVFYRDAAFESPDDLDDLRGARVAVGANGSGTRRLATTLLNAVAIGVQDADLVELPTAEAAEQIVIGKLDVLLFVASPDAPIVQRLVRADGVSLMSLRRAPALSRQVPYLEAVVLPEGALDLEANLPPQDLLLVAPAAMLLTRADAHSAAVLLAAMAAQRTHGGGTLVSRPGDFPSERYIELPRSETADHFFKNGPTFLRRALPFWFSSFVERAVIVIVPLLALLIPLVRVAPPVYRWRVRSRIYRWYNELREIDAVLTDGVDVQSLLDQSARLDELEAEAQGVTVPLSYMEEFYNLRLHIGYLRRRLSDRVKVAMAAREAGDPTPRD